MTELINKINKALEAVRPGLQMDGGDVQLVSFDEASGVAKVCLLGACSHCPMGSATIKNYIEAELKQAVPEVTAVEQV